MSFLQPTSVIVEGDADSVSVQVGSFGFGMSLPWLIYTLQNRNIQDTIMSQLLVCLDAQDVDLDTIDFAAFKAALENWEFRV